jgi:hypothetical protein
MKGASSGIPEVRSSGYLLLAENLRKGDVVMYSYENQEGEVTQSEGVIAKSNRGGIRIIRPGGGRYPLVIINCYGGSIKEKKGNGATDYSRSIGVKAWVERTGETASVDTCRGGRIYTTDYDPNDQ